MGDWATQVAEASATQFWWAVAIGVACVLLATWQATRALAHKRLMEDTPTSLVRSAAQGYIELQGHAILLEGEPIHAALTGQQCVWYRYCVERKERATDHRGQTQTRWRTVERGVSEHLFALRDATGLCVIDPDGARVTPSVKNLWYGHAAQPPRVTQVARWMHFTGLASLGRTYRYVEERITIGSPLYALGLFRSHAGANHAPDPAAVASLLREWKRDPDGLRKRFDRDGNGSIDTEEWEAARRAASAEVGAARHSSLPPAVDTLVDTRDAARPFVLAAAREHDLARRAAWRVGVFGGGALLGASLLAWCLVQRLGGS